MTDRELRKTCRYLVGAARRIWRWNPDRRLVNETAEKASGKKGFRVCNECKKPFSKKRAHVDHRIPVGHAPTKFDGWDQYYGRLFTTSENLQVLCVGCHKAKTKEEAKERRKAA